ncbi:MAG: hypothetical protein KKB31_02365, partial [Nanoarchaeota archaeon]|nr:hypothetical protein [Nanoarchaeota archaeon]
NCLTCQEDCAPCCYDTDEFSEHPLYEKGIVVATNGDSGTDYCDTQDYLYEYICDGNVGMKSQPLYCAGGCKWGACNVCDKSGLYDECESHDDCGANEDCIHCQCVGSYEVSDVTCPYFISTSDGYTFDANDNNIRSCYAFNVKRSYRYDKIGGEWVLVPDPNIIDYVVDEALDCCLGWGVNKISKDNEDDCIEAHSYDPQTIRDCLTRFVKGGVGWSGEYKDYPWIKKYFYAELCCGEEDTCPFNKGVCAPKDGHSDYVQGLTCANYACNKHDFATYFTMNFLNTGTCVDWSFLPTTILRKTGYFPTSDGDLILTVDGDGHFFNIVWMDAYGKWVVLDYGILDFTPEVGGTIDYCDKIDGYCGNDVKKLNCEKDDWMDLNVYGCSPMA